MTLTQDDRTRFARMTKANLIECIARLQEHADSDRETRETLRATIAAQAATIAELQAAQDHVVYRSPLYRAVEALADVHYRRARVESVDLGRFSPSLVIELPDNSAGDVIGMLPGHEYVLISAPAADFDALSQAWCNVEPPEKGAY